VVHRRELLCVVQARTGSSRLPGKVLADLGGRPMLRFLLDRLAPLAVDDIVVATSTEERDDAVADLALAAGRPVVRGSEDDVLDRFVGALDTFPARHVVRITADCPLSDPQLIDAVVAHHLATRADYTTNTLPRTFPKGLDVEVVTADALRVAHAEATAAAEREHVMPFVYRRPERFRLANLRNDQPLGEERWTVDTADDLERVRRITQQMRDAGNDDFGWRDVLAIVGCGAHAQPGTVTLRPAYEQDARFVLDARCDDDAVRFSVIGKAIDPQRHAEWFAHRLAQAGQPFWIGELDGAPIGTVRLDVRGGVGEVAIAVHPRHRGAGHGTTLLRALLEQVAAEQQVTSLVARVHPDNVASMRAFAGVGFTPDPHGTACDHGGFVTLRRDPRVPMETSS
jgi:spore coat polysaccharide biosynthesis protein SpsF